MRASYRRRVTSWRRPNNSTSGQTLLDDVRTDDAEREDIAADQIRLVNRAQRLCSGPK